MNKLLIIVLLFSWFNPLNASVYYVSNNGSNGNTGAMNSPFQTIQFAVNFVAPGDSILVYDGTYEESVNISNSGNSGQYCYIGSLNPQGAKIVLPLSFYNDGIKITGSHWKIQGFEIYDANLTNEDYGHGIHVFNTHHIEIINNHIHDCGGSGIQFNQFDHALIENNRCYRNAKYNPFQCSGISLYQARAVDNVDGYHVIIRNNISFDNVNINTDGNGETTDGNGIIIDDFLNTQSQDFNTPFPHRTLVENNLCYNNGGKGLHTFFSDHVDFFNNTAHHNNYDLLNVGTFRAELSTAFSNDVVWRNNIGVANPGEGILSFNNAILVGYADDVTFENNITFNGVPGEISIFFDNTSLTISNFNASNLLGINPLFSNAISNDFTLSSTSPAINAGSDNIVSFVDLLYSTRLPGSVDIGCYESNLISSVAETVHFDVSVYPNPCTDRICILSKEPIEQMRILTLDGSLVESISPSTGTIDVSHLSAGSYFITILGLNKHQIIRIVKQ